MTSTDPYEGMDPELRDIVERYDRVAEDISPELAALSEKRSRYRKQREARLREPTEMEAQAIGGLVKASGRVILFTRELFKSFGDLLVDHPGAAQWIEMIESNFRVMDVSLESLDPLRKTDGLHPEEAAEYERIFARDQDRLEMLYNAQLERDVLTTACHFKIGDAASSMRLACGFPITDSKWTQNPHETDCPACLVALEGFAQ